MISVFSTNQKLYLIYEQTVIYITSTILSVRKPLLMIQSNTNNAIKQINEKVRNGVYIITHFKPLSQLFFHTVAICFLTQNT